MLRKKDIAVKLHCGCNRQIDLLVEKSPNRFIRKDINFEEFGVYKPVSEMETDLEALRDAGLNPQAVPCGSLLNPSDPVVLSQKATDFMINVAENLNEGNSDNQV